MDRRINSAGAHHQLLMKWAKSQGIEINGVTAVRFPGHGVGIAALRKIDVYEPKDSQSIPTDDEGIEKNFVAHSANMYI